MRRLLAAAWLPAMAPVVLAGCGSSGRAASRSPSPLPAQSSASSGFGPSKASIEALVPATYKTKGTLIVASDATYAPNEFIASDGHTVIGMDADLMKALGEQMGLKVDIVNATFDTIIPGIRAGKFDIGASSFTDTEEREKVVEFVDYFNAGVSFYAKASANRGVETIEDICDRTVSVERGTTEEEEATAQAAKCKKQGKKPDTVLVYPTQDAVDLAISSARAELGMADSPVAAYQVKQSEGRFKLVGAYGATPYGLAVPKGSGLAKPLLQAVKAVIANGTYIKILDKWGIESGAISAPAIDGAKS